MTPAELASLHALCFTTPRPWTEAEFAAFLSSPGVALSEGEAGFALGRTIAGEAELLTIAVHPAAQGQGHGGRLLSAFERQARAMGATEAFLEVAEDNLPARALYARAGYAPAGRRRGYYTTPQGARTHALILRRSL